jgi:thiol-disulfide isomerase/thioredoxin
LLLLLALIWAAAPAAADELAFDALNQPAPDFGYRDGPPPPHRLKDELGHPLVLHLWATWCTSCKVELPSLAAFAAKLGHGVRFLAIAVDAEAQRPQVTAFLKPLPGPILAPLLVDPDDREVKPYLTWGLPATYLINARGVVVSRALGARGWQTTPGAAAQVLALLGAS